MNETSIKPRNVRSYKTDALDASFLALGILLFLKALLKVLFRQCLGARQRET